MRKVLRSLNQKQLTFIGTVKQFGRRYYPRNADLSTSTVLLVDVYCQEKNIIVTDHAWIDLSRALIEMGLRVGDRVKFRATVQSYAKGRDKRLTDYKLSSPNNFAKVYQSDWYEKFIQ